ncbi:unnamed protein product [Spirodela intermedia]|uniref:Uncharacterized protein n=1 Tax=Spirodela intermedia TaxID=51605 RepID=A0A7I8ISQ7_SPIIN|nr:unnamed protein product [Spirodela intermedia]CAA6661011.1 unnamed protein product [Spirodela intermedia]
MLTQGFIFDGGTILVHGFSRSCWKLRGWRRRAGRYSGGGEGAGGVGIPAKLVIDSAVAYAIFVGADGVVESSGIICMMGTYQTVLVVHSMNKRVYFARRYPLNRKDLDGEGLYTPRQCLTLLRRQRRAHQALSSVAGPLDF